MFNFGFMSFALLKSIKRTSNSQNFAPKSEIKVYFCGVNTEVSNFLSPILFCSTGYLPQTTFFLIFNSFAK